MGYKNIFRRSKDLTKMSTDFITNKFVLYFVFVLAVGNLVQLFYAGEFRSIGIFVASGFMTSFFSKNITVILIISIVVANVFVIGKAREGFWESKKEKEEEDTDTPKKKAKKEEEEEDTPKKKAKKEEEEEDTPTKKAKKEEEDTPITKKPKKEKENEDE
jgi:hypothetical protein